MRRFDPPAGWRASRLKFVATIAAGGTPRVDDPRYWSDDGEGVAWAAIGDMTREPLLRSTTRRVSPTGIKAARLPVGAPGTLLFAMYASLGAMARLEVEATWNQAIVGITPRPGISTQFLAYALQSSRATFASLARSNTQDNLNQEQVGNLPLLIPDGEHQRRIADFLDRECDRIGDLLTKLNTLATRAAGALSQRVAEELERPNATVRPLTWGVDLARPVMYGIVLPGEPVDDGVLLVKGGNVERGELEPHQLVKVAVGIEKRFARSRLQAGDLLMTIRGSFGAVAVVPEAIAGANITQDTARITPTNPITGRYLAHALRGTDAQRQINERVRGTGVRGLNIYDLKRIQLPFPAIEDQDRIATLLDRRAKEMERAGADMRRFGRSLREYRDALIAEAVTGQLDISRLSDAQLNEAAQAAMEGERPEVLSA